MSVGSVSNLSYVPGPDSGLSLWNFSFGKRFFDAVCAATGLLLTLPLMAIIAVAIRVSMPGPILFRQLRVGRDARLFHILKFRTMRVLQPGSAPKVTRRGDARITPLGRILRRFKLDELPQLFNVLRGDMSLVGPRPDVPEYCQSLAPEFQSVFALRPGVTGRATLHFRDEEGVLAAIPPEQLTHYYVSTLLPEKIGLDLDYARHATFFGDLRIVLQTLTGASPQA